MSTTEAPRLLFIGWAFLFQIILIAHFALRRWRFDTAIRYGWIVYALSAPAIAVSGLLYMSGESWWLWVGGVLCLAWAIYGYAVDYWRRIQWRAPIRWAVGGPYVFLYLAMLMFYWWPVGLISKSLWYVYAVLFIVSTFLNVTSHQAPTGQNVV